MREQSLNHIMSTTNDLKAKYTHSPSSSAPKITSAIERFIAIPGFSNVDISSFPCLKIQGHLGNVILNWSHCFKDLSLNSNIWIQIFVFDFKYSINFWGRNCPHSEELGKNYVTRASILARITKFFFTNLLRRFARHDFPKPRMVSFITSNVLHSSEISSCIY